MAMISPYARTPVPLSDRGNFAQRQAGIGGGPSASLALDPSGIVPVNRTQPVATDGVEAQRLMERRTGAQPPSSFSGAGAGFIPPQPTAFSAPVANPAERMTDYSNAEQFGGNSGTAPMPPISGEAQRRLAMANGLGAPGRAVTRETIEARRRAVFDRLRGRLPGVAVDNLPGGLLGFAQQAR